MQGLSEESASVAQLDERRLRLDQELEAVRTRVAQLRKALSAARTQVVLGVPGAVEKVTRIEADLSEAEKQLARQQALCTACEPLRSAAASREAEALKARAKEEADAHDQARDEQLAIAAHHLASAAEALRVAESEDGAAQSIKRQYGWRYVAWGVTRAVILKELDRGGFIPLRDVFESPIGFGYLKGERAY